eukprot:5638102-Heterocapsa_arctica.AAC.2
MLRWAWLGRGGNPAPQAAPTPGEESTDDALGSLAPSVRRSATRGSVAAPGGLAPSVSSPATCGGMEAAVVGEDDNSVPFTAVLTGFSSWCETAGGPLGRGLRR